MTFDSDVHFWDTALSFLVPFQSATFDLRLRSILQRTRVTYVTETFSSLSLAHLLNLEPYWIFLV